MSQSGFLVLSRKPGELIRVVVLPSDTPKTMWIRVETCDRTRARIGLQADPAIEILRAELTETEPAPAVPPVAEAATAA